MKNLFFFSLIFLLLTEAGTLNAQTGPRKRCYTTEYYKELFKNNPSLKAKFETNQARLNKGVHILSTERTAALLDTIPVVIHVIGNEALHASVTDAVLLSQIDVLNQDFGGSNRDSSRIPASFKSIFGKTGLTFMMARRTPAGTLTNGIERRTNSITFTGSTADDAKSTMAGGLDGWDSRNYLNLWVVSFGNSGILGISIFPGDPRPTAVHGFVCDYRAFGKGAPYLFPEYNMGRTTTHELGHFWNLRHIWGDDDGGCTGSDFPNSPAGMDDTPNQADATYGNSDLNGTGQVLTDNCSGAAPGIMYQNYMDYSDDVALVMFTRGQSRRMEAALTGSPDRSPLLRANTYRVFSNDAGILRIQNPSNGSQFCSLPLQPRVVVKNEGNNTVSSVRVHYSLNGAPWTSSTFPVTIAPNGGQATVTLPSLTAVPGANSFTVFTSLTGAPDENVTNDTLSSSFVIPTGVSLPVRESFESGAFPPQPWTVFNPGNDATWGLKSPGNNSQYALFIDNYTNEALNQQDDFRSPILFASGLDSVVAQFDLAAKYYPDPINYDTLTVLMSTDCGATFTPVYKKWGQELATAGPSEDEYTSPGITDWRRERISIPASAFPEGKLLLAFRNTNRFGNNFFIDNIHLYGIHQRDLQVEAVKQPKKVICTGNFTPIVTVRNAGMETITGFTVTYRVDGGLTFNKTVTGVSLPQNGTLDVTLSPAKTDPGQHLLTIYSMNPVTANGTGDQNLYNDTLTYEFGMSGKVDPPIVQSFDGPKFPPAGWVVVNEDKSQTWTRSSVGFQSPGSAYLNSFNYQSLKNRDDLYSPIASFGIADSLLLEFDLSAATYSNPGSTNIPMDTVEILVTADCGNTFQSVYKKWGAELQTLRNVTTGQTDEFFPANATQWRHELLDLSRFLTGNVSLQVVFRINSNYENNIFLDNVLLRSRVLPQQLKQQGYLLLPTPFEREFKIWHLQQPQTLRSVKILSSSGQQVWSRQFNGNADKVIDVNLQGQSAGIYFVQMGYEGGRNVTQRIVKH